MSFFLDAMFIAFSELLTTLVTIPFNALLAAFTELAAALFGAAI
jgi:hypothetical protein